MLVRTGHRGIASGCAIEVTYTGDEANANLYSKAVAAGWTDGCSLLCTINSGVDLYSTNSTPGFQISHTGTDMGFTSGTEITIINNGSIWGSSGSGGSAGTSSGQVGSAGSTGGVALKLKQNNSSGTLDGVTIHFTNNGVIKGGGGGGGGGGCGTDYQSSYSCTVWEPTSGYNFSNVNACGGGCGTGYRITGCDGPGCTSAIVDAFWSGSNVRTMSNQNMCGCPTPANFSNGSYSYYSSSGTYQTDHDTGKIPHFLCFYQYALKRSYSGTCYTQHTHGDGGNGGTGGDWDSSGSSGVIGQYGSPNGNGTEDGGTGGTGGDPGVVGYNGNTAPNSGAAGGSGGAAGYYLNYNVGNTSGWTLVNNGTVAGQVG